MKEILSIEKAASGLPDPLSSAHTRKRLLPGDQARLVKVKVLRAGLLETPPVMRVWLGMIPGCQVLFAPVSLK